ncbi:MAG: carboxypeptidase regulatory-like domain-containing protein [Myxococcaceae bacterium]|nr:carboxypeptidase regulatory-like domain-containing protein [Myxococcaceae bacterium]
MNRILSACAIFALASCANYQDLNGDGVADADEKGRAPDTTQLIAPSSPVGTVSGVVVTTLQTPIEGVNATLVLGEGADATHTYKATTSADGAFVFKDVPAGAQAQVLLSKTGYSSARINANVPATGGNVPINNGNGNVGVISLAQLSSTLKFRVYTSLGKSAKGAKAYLEVNPTAFVTTAGTYGGGIGNYSGTADVDDNGLLTFANAPDPGELARIATSTFTLTIGALDEDNDGRADILGTVQTYSASGLFIQPDRTIILNDARTGASLQILGTNVESLTTNGSEPYRNALKANDSINIVFNQPITQVDTTRLVKVVQENCETNVAVSVTQRAPNVLSIAPTAPWTLGNRYNIIVRATGLDSGSTVDFIGYFFAIDATVPRPLSTTAAFQVRKASGNTMSNALQPGDTLNVVFDTPVTAQGGAFARAIVNFDLNGDGMTGGMLGFGEFNGPPNSGFVIGSNEQTTANDPANGTFTCKTSGYSSRWSINITFPMSGFVPSATQMRVLFPKDQASSQTFQTAWGSPVQADVTGTINVVP